MGIILVNIYIYIYIYKTETFYSFLLSSTIFHISIIQKKKNSILKHAKKNIKRKYPTNCLAPTYKVQFNYYFIFRSPNFIRIKFNLIVISRFYFYQTSTLIGYLLTVWHRPKKFNLIIILYFIVLFLLDLSSI